MADERNRANIFHRTIDLQIGLGCETLRRLLREKLDGMNISLKDYLNRRTVRSTLSGLCPIYLPKEQFDLLYPAPNEQRFDYSLLTLLLLNGDFVLTKYEKTKIKKLRGLRNNLSHVPRPELADETIFIEGSHLIIDLAKTCGKEFGKQMKRKIMELKANELVAVRSNIEIVKLRNESFVVKLVESKGEVQADTSGTTLLRYGLTKWVKQFTEIVQLDSFMSELKRMDVLSFMEKSFIEKHYNKSEQCNALIMKILDDTDEQLWAFLRCLRAKYSHLTDLIENKADDGADIELKLRRMQDLSIKSVITRYFERDDEEKVVSEDLHIAVEDGIGYHVPFSLVESAVEEEFGVKLTSDSWFYGMKWSQNREEVINTNPYFFPKTDAETYAKEEDGFIVCTCKTFGDKVGTIIDNVKEGYGDLIREAIIEECISPKIFSELEEAEMKSWLKDYMHGKKLVLGVVKELMEIRRNIQDEIKKSQRSAKEVSTTFRAFDSNDESTIYHFDDIVKPPTGNLLIPVHEFRTITGINTSQKAYIARECVQFVCACINTRKNGTIHFGIESIGTGLGRVHGVKLSEMSDNVDLDLYVENALDACFDQGQLMHVKRCIRPFQSVLVDNNSIVLEMDVVPSSWCMDELFCEIKFPPKGKQTDSMFVYTVELKPELIGVPLNKVEQTKCLYTDNLKGRRLLEDQMAGRISKLNERESALRRRITAGSKYITDQFFPIIFCGKITGTENESNSRETFKAYMADVFRSSAIIFDFDPSPVTRTMTEEITSAMYQIRTTEGGGKLIDDTSTESCWIYCNGNSDLSISEMSTNEWLPNRSPIVKRALSDIRGSIPHQRALLIFLFFESSFTHDSPIATIAEECMVSSFRNECVVISSSAETISELKSNVLKRKDEGEDFDQHFHTEFQWEEIAIVLKSVSRTSSNNNIQLPCKNGKIVFLSSKRLEQMKLTDIEIVSGAQCIEIDEMDKEAHRTKMMQEKERFYRGEEVSWWNFLFDNQVGERDMYPILMESVRDKMKKGDSLVEVETVMHHPGAGGTTAGKYMIWNMSQFRFRGSEGAFRCCIVRQITEQTADQIYDFMSFKDKSPKSAVVLIDNFSDDSICLLKDSLYQKAYKRHLAENNVFCVLIVVRRVIVKYDDKPDDHVLKHTLSTKEQIWFEKKYKELENTDEIDVETLILFNVMRKSFDEKYIQNLVTLFLKGVREDEIQVLKCLSLINMFDRDSVIPFNIFDYLISGRQAKSGILQLGNLIGKGPVGLVVPFRDRRAVRITGSPWNTSVTDEFSLLTKRRYGKTSKSEIGSEYAGLMMISHALAKSVLFRIIETEQSSLTKIIIFVLQIVKEHVSETNQMSKEFIKIVNSLFKTRQILTEEGELRAKFSEMVMYLKEGDHNEIVIDLMKECFEITRDAMVGQQLSRFYIFLKQYTNAEEEIAQAIEIQPKSSYLLDTYGQIFFSQMEHLFTVKSSEMGKIPDDDAAEIIKIAFNALDKFKAGQTITSEKEDGDNTSCYFMEVKTILHLLENFVKFACHRDERELLCFLNNVETEIPKSYSQLNRLCDLMPLTRNSVTQAHTEESLRLLEERNYQLKRRFYTVPAAKDEKLLLKLRERFERFYGSAEVRESFKFKFGVGLKSLMIACKDDKMLFLKRIDEALVKLEESEKRVDKRDLLVVLGNAVIKMSEKGAEESLDERPMEMDRYNALLRYSERLLDIEGKSKRPYLEAYLYYTMLNWPSESREDVVNLGKPEKLKHVLKDWEDAFVQNFRTEARRKSPYPKTYFALGKGPLGCDIVDFSLIEKKWRESTRKKRQYVQDDHVWLKPYVQNILKRLEGTLNDSGTLIRFETKHQYWTYQHNIACQQPNKNLCNRRVSFILVFTWAGPKATDINDIAAKSNIEDDGPSSLEGKDDAGNDADRKHREQKPKKGNSPKHRGGSGKSGKKKKAN